MFVARQKGHSLVPIHGLQKRSLTALIIPQVSLTNITIAYKIMVGYEALVPYKQNNCLIVQQNKK